MSVKLHFPSGNIFHKNNNYYSLYGVKENFKLIPVYSIDYKIFYWLNKKLWFYLKIISFNFFLLIKLFFSEQNEIIYSRDVKTFKLLIFLKSYKLIKNKVFLEIHDFKNSYLTIKNVDGIIVLNKILKSKFSQLKIPVLVAHDGVNLTNFKVLDKLKARKKLSLDFNELYCLYSGRYRTLGKEKGIPDIINASKYLNQKIKFIFVGGPIDEIDHYKHLIYNNNLKLENFIFKDYVSLKVLKLYLSSADLFLMPFPNDIHFSENMSPLKMFEYMAMKRPIVTTNLPSIMEILNDGNSFICKPNDPIDLASKINEALKTDVEKTSKAFETVKKYTWDKRARNIINFINESSTI